jgi:CubicO group peptidase (beta-lactamase class C family)
MNRILMPILFFVLTLNSYAQETKKNYKDAFRLIEVWLEAQKDFENIPSITAMVVKDQDILWSKAIGQSNLEQNSKATLTTTNSICSITKSFTAVAIMKLIDEGKINLDDKVKDLLPFYKTKSFSNGDATIKSLLSHSSGLPGNSGHSYFTGPSFIFPSKTEFRSIFKDLKTTSKVGSDVKYSNVGYALLGEIIETVSGIPYAVYLKNEVLNPLKMTNTYISNTTRNSLYTKATGYTAINRNRNRNRVNLFDTKSMQPAMGLWTNITDLAKYASWQFRLQDASSAEILKPFTLQNMHSVQATSKDKNTTWGLGFEVFKGSNNEDWVSHGGTCPGFVSLLQLNKTTKVGYGVMINANRSSSFKYINGIKQILSKVKQNPENSKKELSFLKDYTGYYNMNPWNSLVYVGTWNDGLVVLQLPENSPKYGMMFYKHIKGDIFRHVKKNGELGDQFEFQRDKSGKVYRYFESGNYKNKVIN